MHILAVDTSYGPCTVTINHKDNPLCELKEERPSRQAEMLVPLIEEALYSTKLSYGDISVLVSTTGPGSFTGVRIGMSAVKGIELVTGIEEFGVTTLETIAWHACGKSDDRIIVSCLNAMRGQLYVQSFAKNDDEIINLDAASVIAVDDIDNYIAGINKGSPAVVTNCKEIVKPYISGNNKIFGNMAPNASDAASLAYNMYKNGVRRQNPAPLYIRAPDAVKSCT